MLINPMAAVVWGSCIPDCGCNVPPRFCKKFTPQCCHGSIVAAGVVVGIACIIIVLIFVTQRFGTSRVGACFAPIVLIYFLCNLIIAITNISRYNPTIFKVIIALGVS